MRLSPAGLRVVVERLADGNADPEQHRGGHEPERRQDDAPTTAPPRLPPASTGGLEDAHGT